MTKNNLKLMDMDEHLRTRHEARMKDLLETCKVFDLTLDLAASDVVMYLENRWGKSLCIG